MMSRLLVGVSTLNRGSIPNFQDCCCKGTGGGRTPETLTTIRRCDASVEFRGSRLLRPQSNQSLRPSRIPREANAAELCVSHRVLPPRHSVDAEQLLWFGERGYSMPAILKRLATVTVLLATLLLLTASGGSYMRGELLLDIQKTIR